MVSIVGLLFIMFVIVVFGCPGPSYFPADRLDINRIPFADAEAASLSQTPQFVALQYASLGSKFRLLWCGRHQNYHQISYPCLLFFPTLWAVSSASIMEYTTCTWQSLIGSWFSEMALVGFTTIAYMPIYMPRGFQCRGIIPHHRIYSVSAGKISEAISD